MTESQKKAFNEMAIAMDKRDKYLFMLKDYYLKHGKIPDATPPLDKDYHRDSFDAFRRDGFKSWRCQPKVKKRLIKAAKKADKAKGLEVLTEEQRQIGLKELSRSE